MLQKLLKHFSFRLDQAIPMTIVHEDLNIYFSLLRFLKYTFVSNTTHTSLVCTLATHSFSVKNFNVYAFS
jgi:hypothetical protein